MPLLMPLKRSYPWCVCVCARARANARACVVCGSVCVERDREREVGWCRPAALACSAAVGQRARGGVGALRGAGAGEVAR
jgi:hypothetical protein